jgi:hypothetical protein
VWKFILYYIILIHEIVSTILSDSPVIHGCEELDDPAASALRRAIATVQQRWSVIDWVTKNLLSRTPPCFGRHVKPLVSAAFVVVSNNQPAQAPRGGLWPVLLMCNP